MKKLLWFSRHKLTEAQYKDLQNIYQDDFILRQVNITINSAKDILPDLEWCDIAAVVMPLHLQQEALEILKPWNKPMLVCSNHRVQKEDGSFHFLHAGWCEITKIDIVKKTLSYFPQPEGSFR